jgi:hypothetical protein
LVLLAVTPFRLVIAVPIWDIPVSMVFSTAAVAVEVAPVMLVSEDDVVDVMVPTLVLPWFLIVVITESEAWKSELAYEEKLSSNFFPRSFTRDSSDAVAVAASPIEFPAPVNASLMSSQKAIVVFVIRRKKSARSSRKYTFLIVYKRFLNNGRSENKR